MNDKYLEILYLRSKIWISEDQNTKIKFQRNTGTDDGFLRYSINGDLIKTPVLGACALDDKSFTFWNVNGNWGVTILDDNTISVSLPEIAIENLHQIDDPDEID